MSLLPRSLWKIFQLMVSNAKEPSRKLAGVSSLLSVHLLHWKCFLSEYLKQDIIWFYLHFSDYDWSGYFFSVYFLLAFPSLWIFYSYIKGPLKKKNTTGLVNCFFAIFSNKLGHRPNWGWALDHIRHSDTLRNSIWSHDGWRVLRMSNLNFRNRHFLFTLIFNILGLWPAFITIWWD